MSLLARTLIVAVAVTWSAAAFSDDQQFVCKPLDPNGQSYFVRCDVLNGVPRSSCGCNAGFVLVDISTLPSAVPPENASEH